MFHISLAEFSVFYSDFFADMRRVVFAFRFIWGVKHPSMHSLVQVFLLVTWLWFALRLVAFTVACLSSALGLGPWCLFWHVFRTYVKKTLKSGRSVKFCRTDNNAIHRSPDLQQSTPSPPIIHHSYLSPLFRQSTSLIHSSKSLDPCLCPYIMQKYRNIYCNLDSLWHMFGRLYYVNGIKLKIISSG